MDKAPITTIKSALKWAHLLLQDTTPDYILEARILLCEVMAVKQEYLIRYPDKALTHQQTEAFQRLVLDRAKGNPLPYLLGKQSFYDIEVTVSPDVLIPRPETELLVEKALEWGKGRAIRGVDVGTGSGILALVLAKHLPQAQITGIDLSPAALNIARQNSERLHLNIRWLEGNLLAPLLEQGEQMDLIVANLPYIAQGELSTLAVAQHEPHLALDGGEDGLALIREFLQAAPRVLAEQGLLLMEIGTGQGAAVQELAQAAFPQRTVKITPDLAGHDRLASVES